MSFEGYLILIGIILILIDNFVVSDLLTFLALLLFSYVFYRFLPFTLLVKIILTILFFMVLLVTYLTIWRRLETIFVDKFFAKDKYRAGVYGLPGKQGYVRTVEGEKFACIDGDLYAFHEECLLPDEAEFTVKEVKDSKIVIE